MKQKLLFRLKVKINIGGCDYTKIHSKWDIKMCAKDNEMVLFFKGEREFLYCSKVSVVSHNMKKMLNNKTSENFRNLSGS